MPLPQYQSHKVVRAVRIGGISLLPHGDAMIHPLVPAGDEAGDISVFSVSPAYYAKHQPKVGGYYVVYADGYESFSPAEAFEQGYTRVRPDAPPPRVTGTGLTPDELAALEETFTYHAPTPEQITHYAAVREAAKHFAAEVLRHVPKCADRSSAMRHIRVAVMEANAGIAIPLGKGL